MCCNLRCWSLFCFIFLQYGSENVSRYFPAVTARSLSCYCKQPNNPSASHDSMHIPRTWGLAEHVHSAICPCGLEGAAPSQGGAQERLDHALQALASCSEVLCSWLRWQAGDCRLGNAQRQGLLRGVSTVVRPSKQQTTPVLVESASLVTHHERVLQVSHLRHQPVSSRPLLQRR